MIKDISQLDDEVQRIIQGNDYKPCFKYNQEELEYILDRLMLESPNVSDYEQKNIQSWVMQTLSIAHKDQKSKVLIKEYIYTAVLYIRTYGTKLILLSAHLNRYALTDDTSFYKALTKQKDISWVLNILAEFKPQEITVLYIHTQISITDKDRSLQDKLKIIQTRNLFVKVFNEVHTAYNDQKGDELSC